VVLERSDWSRLDQLLEDALELQPAERERFLDEACQADAESRARLGELLRIAEDTESGLRAGEALRGPDFEEVAREIETEGLPSLAPGAPLGRFVLGELLGQGGMGSVYRALDPALGREVAIKAVAHDIRRDPGSLRRFEREARLLATLNHPNIAGIYGLELIEGAPYLVLELVEGETLAERLERGRLPLAEAVAVGVQIADALQEAHEKGIVHRDLKPANVKLAPGGRVKVLDFGIAKLVGASEDGAPPTLASEPTTMPGALLGTAPYMSPEQARGLAVDPRSDVWAFGCVLYEMLTGRRAFQGRTASDVLAAVLRDDIDWTALPAETPREVRRLLRRCLRKEPRDRLQNAGDARIELTDAATEEPPAPLPRRTPRIRSLPALLAGLALGALLTAVAVRRTGLPEGAARVTRLSLDLPAGLTLAEDFAPPFAFAPDGSSLALVASEATGPAQLYERPMGGLELRRIPGTEGARQPVFAPDGLSLAFFADRKLKRVPRGGGAVETLAEIGGNLRGASFGSDGSIVLAPHQTSGLVRIEAPRGPLRPLTRVDEAEGETSHRWPQVLPGGRHVLFTVALEGGSYDDARIDAVELASGRRTRVLEGGAYARYVPGGNLAFVRAGRLLAVPFDLETLATRGAPEVVVEGVRYSPQSGGSHFTLSDTGSLAYTPALATTQDHALSVVEPSGRVGRIGETPRPYREPSLSPDSKRAAVVIGDAAESDLWVVDVASGTHSRLTFGMKPRRPTWTSDGERITVGVPHGHGSRLVTVSRDGGGSPDVLLETPHRAYPSAWSPDGRTFVYQERRPETGWDLLALDLGRHGDFGSPRPLVATPFEEANASLSADGRFLAYESDELDSIFEIYVRPLAGEGPKVRASMAGARWPRFGPPGQLYCWQSSGGGLQRIRYRVEGDRFVVGGVEAVWPGDRVSMSGFGGYDVEHARERFLVLEEMGGAAKAPYQHPLIVLDWARELRSRESPRSR
jgi:serine/threonine-protein kinase